MINQSTLDTLRAMKLSAMAKELEAQLSDHKAYGQLGFEERLGLLVDAEWSRRQNNKLARYTKNAKFAIPSASIEGIEYHEDRKLDKAELLRFATCKFIAENHHIILKGASGNGKTYISNALGKAACRKFKSVRYIRMLELLDELSIARGCGNFKKAVKAYQKADLLILDEWLIRTLTPQEAYDLLEIVEARCQKGSMILCTQYETEGWYRRINPDPGNDSPISEAIMDRIIHNAYEVMIDGRVSMRERHGINSPAKGVASDD
jgi:DNA replication protein DnaC